MHRETYWQHFVTFFCKWPFWHRYM
jgi:hypothetical protein